MDVFILANNKLAILEGVFSSEESMHDYLNKEVKKGNIEAYNKENLHKLVSTNGFYCSSQFEPFTIYKTKVI